jgi:hypothetical protein
MKIFHQNGVRVISAAIGLIPIFGLWSCADRTYDNPVDPSFNMATPLNLKAIVESDTTIRISWDYTGRNLGGFEIQRQVGLGTYQDLTSTGAAIRQYTDRIVVTNGQSYSYRVRAACDANRSAYCQAATVSFASGLIAFYPFNGSADDASGNGHNGVVYGARSITDRKGNLNSSYEFDGTSNKIETSELRVPVNSFSVSLWFKTSVIVADNYQEAIGDAGGYRGFRVYRSSPSGDSLRFEIQGQSVVQDVAFKLLLSDANQWIHLVGISDNGKLKIYRNSTLQASTSCPLGDNQDYVSLGIGYDPNVNSGWWNGGLDDIRIYDRALTDTEIQRLYILNL